MTLFLVQAAVGYPTTRSLPFLWGAISKTTDGFKSTRFSIISRFAFFSVVELSKIDKMDRGSH